MKKRTVNVQFIQTQAPHSEEVWSFVAMFRVLTHEKHSSKSERNFYVVTIFKVKNICFVCFFIDFVFEAQIGKLCVEVSRLNDAASAEITVQTDDHHSMFLRCCPHAESTPRFASWSNFPGEYNLLQTGEPACKLNFFFVSNVAFQAMNLSLGCESKLFR